MDVLVMACHVVLGEVISQILQSRHPNHKKIIQGDLVHDPKIKHIHYRTPLLLDEVVDNAYYRRIVHVDWRLEWPLFVCAPSH